MQFDAKLVSESTAVQTPLCHGAPLCVIVHSAMLLNIILHCSVLDKTFFAPCCISVVLQFTFFEHSLQNGD